MIPVVPFLYKKVHLRLEGCGCHEGLTLFSGNPRHEGLGYSSTMGIPWGRNQGLYRVREARIHNWIGGSRDELPKLLHKSKLGEDLTKKCTQALGETQIALVEM